MDVLFFYLARLGIVLGGGIDARMRESESEGEMKLGVRLGVAGRRVMLCEGLK